jgi:H+/Cl- antiporter ClcA
MERRRNFLPLIGFLTCLLAVFSYIFFFVRFPVTRDVPWTAWILLALGLGLAGAGVARAFRQPERFRGRWSGRGTGSVLAALSLVVVGFFLFITTAMSRDIPAAANAPKVGAQAPDFTLPDVNGKPVRLYDLLGSGAGGTSGASAASWVVLIFYRGYW